ncbi:unnamed protein product, partial [Discosporangium mesarthrocarpum]
SDISAEKYWRVPLTPLLSANSLVEFVVLDCEPVTPLAHGHGHRTGAGAGGGAGGEGKQMVLAEAVVARASDMGATNDTFNVMTHLGGRLEAGDLVLGYDLRGTNFNDSLLSGLTREIPDVVLVKKKIPLNKGKKRNKVSRGWK